MDKQLIGACGIFCAACDHYLAHTANGSHLLDKSNPNSQKLLAHSCGGCKCENENKICIYCRGCEIRLCTLEKGIELCSMCSNFPCDKIKPFENNGLEHKKEAFASLAKNKTLNADSWFKLCKTRWCCPACGKPHSYYEAACASCGAKLNHLSPDNR